MTLSCNHNYVLFLSMYETYVFCPVCGRMVDNTETQSVASDQEEHKVIESNFLGGYKYETILCFCQNIMALIIQSQH